MKHYNNLDDFDKRYIWESIDPFDQSYEYHDKTDILNMEPLTYPNSFNKNVCRIYLKDDYVYSNTNFHTGDIVEICPCDIISDFVVRNTELSDMVFEIDDHKYALPHGYCQYYDVTTDADVANCDYIWDPNMKQIVIRCTKKCPKDTRLKLNVLNRQKDIFDKQFNV